jgi:3-keto-5-aminohexanoate cleavage enzyme
MKQTERRRIAVAVAPVGKGDPPPSGNPLSPEEVARTVIDCARAGAAMVHLHVRDQTGRQTANQSAFAQTLDMVRESCDIVIQGSTGGASDLTVEERCVALNDPRVEVASLNMGSVNFEETVYINSLPDIRYWASRMQSEKVVPELEIFEAGMLAAAARLVDKKTLQPPYYFNFGLGFHHALPADTTCLFFLKSMLPTGSLWGLVHDKMTDLSLLAAAIGLGASVVRVGFEDSIFYAPGEAARSNVELVERLVAMIRNMGCEPASPSDARRLMGVTLLRGN